MINSTIRKWVFTGMLSFPAFTLLAQEPMREKQVPQEIRDDFALRFHEAQSIQWHRDRDQYIGANFKVQDQQVQVVYQQTDGQWVQTQEDIPYVAMPDPARAHLGSTYPEYTAKEILKVSTRRYGILYEILIQNASEQIALTFDMHGKLLEKTSSDLTEATDPDGNPTMKDKLNGIFKKGER